MQTIHRIFYKTSQLMDELDDNSIELMITSPPYPMIEMWDDIFSSQNEEIKLALEEGNDSAAFEKMNEELDKVWREVYRVLIPGGIACINIGDATRTIDKNFQLFPSHARIIDSCRKIGFQNLPEILWRKQTNAPNKFMGSGMLPPSAYVTLEHEYILIFRKGRKRKFDDNKRVGVRRESSYFWEERNIWFSDIWDFKGTNQELNNKETRKRSAAFPFELTYRLINMFSLRDDTVLDPFVGTGTSSIAAMVSERNSIGYEIDINLKNTIENRFKEVLSFGNKIIYERIAKHREFIKDRIENKGPTEYYNDNLKIPVMTNQEKKLKFNLLKSITKEKNGKYYVSYDEYSPESNKLFKRKDKSIEKKIDGWI